MAVISRDEREGSEQMKQAHPIATAACIILTIAFGLFCLHASTATSVRELAAQHRVARAQVNADRPTSTSTYVTPHLNQAQLASGMQRHNEKQTPAPTSNGVRFEKHHDSK